MQKYFLLFLFLFSSFISVLAQKNYSVSKDEKHPDQLVFKGLINKTDLESEPAFKWYAAAQKEYQPAAALVEKWKQADSSLRVIIFGGTWCDDTQYILPRFLKWASLGGFPDSCINIFGVDRQKKSLGEISAAFQISHVPTFIVMKNGKEVGRVVEYGETGKWEEEIAALIR